MVKGDPDYLVVLASANEDFMRIFNELELPVAHLGMVYQGYRIAQYLNSVVSEDELMSSEELKEFQELDLPKLPSDV